MKNRALFFAIFATFSTSQLEAKEEKRLTIFENEIILLKGKDDIWVNKRCLKKGNKCPVYKKIKQAQKANIEELQNGVSGEAQRCLSVEGKYAIARDKKKNEWGVCLIDKDYVVEASAFFERPDE